MTTKFRTDQKHRFGRILNLPVVGEIKVSSEGEIEIDSNQVMEFLNFEVGFEMVKDTQSGETINSTLEVNKSVGSQEVDKTEVIEVEEISEVETTKSESDTEDNKSNNSTEQETTNTTEVVDKTEETKGNEVKKGLTEDERFKLETRLNDLKEKLPTLKQEAAIQRVQDEVKEIEELLNVTE